MTQVTFLDDQKRLRLLQVAVRVIHHLCDAVYEDHQSDDELILEQLVKRWPHLEDDLSVAQFVEQFQIELGPLAGQAIFDQVRNRLGEKRYDYAARIAELNSRGFQNARKCVAEWGGKLAKEQVKKLKPLQVQCETAANEVTELFYVRSSKPRIVLRPGHPEKLLSDCLLLEFSFFHEYLSHAFPNWEFDDDRLSEGWLLALEFEWFKEEYTFLDRQALVDSWLPRLGKSKRNFWVADWLLGRCDDKVCAKKFMLEWAAQWDQIDDDANQDLISLITGAMKKTGYKLGGLQPQKRANTLKVLDQQICGPCKHNNWRIKEIRDALAVEMERYDA